MEINNIPFQDYFREGKEIIVPLNKEKYFEYYTVKKGDSLYKIAREKNLNPELISIKTLDAYLSDHSDNLSVDEMNEYKDKLAKTERKDRRELVNYMDYLIANINKKRL
jgi:hypothetical protein